MNNVDKFKEIFQKYYKRDVITLKQQKDMDTNSLKKLKEHFNSISRMERKLHIKIPELYKSFIESESGWYIKGDKEEINLYNETEIYEFNYIGEFKGASSFEELKDLFVIGQDNGEYWYFMDPLNKLGYGKESVWKVDCSSCTKSNFELIADNFLKLADKYCNKDDSIISKPFSNENIQPQGYSIDDVINKYLGKNKNFLNIENDIYIKIEKYFDLMKEKNITCRIKKYYNSSGDKSQYIIPTLKNLSYEILYLIQNFRFSIYSDVIFDTMCNEEFIDKNYGKDSLHILKDMFVFASTNKSIFCSEKENSSDYFFVDPQNQLGKGPDAIYVICNKSKDLEEAYYVAKDIVDLFKMLEKYDIKNLPIKGAN